MINEITEDIDSVTVSESCESDVERVSRLIPSSYFKIITQNIRSLNCNLDSLNILLHTLALDYDLVVLTECWLSCCDVIPKLDGFYSFATKNNKNQNDGVVIYIKNNLPISIHELNDFRGANCVLATVEQDLAIINIYRSPSTTNIDPFLDSLNALLNTLTQYKNITIIGDINIAINNTKIDNQGVRYLTLLACHGVHPGHTFITRDLSGTCLDHVMLKSKVASHTVVIESTVTDHKAVMLCLDLAKQPSTAFSNFTRTIINFEALDTDIDNINIEPIFKCTDAEACLDHLTLKLQNAIDKNTKILKLPRRKRVIKPWITPGLLKCIKNRDKLHKKAKINPSNNVLKITYSRYRNYCNKILKKLKLVYEKS